jgi:hypothetical protein
MVKHLLLRSVGAIVLVLVPPTLLAHQPPHSSTPSTPTTSHQHRQLEIPPDQPVPTVKLVAHPDAIRGVNLEIQVTNFTFAPQRLNSKSLATEGHAHLYVNGKKVTRLYGTWYYLGDLPPGKHQITVTLNTNAHEDLVYGSKVISSSIMVDVPAIVPSVDHHH